MTPLQAYNLGLCNYVYRTKEVANRSHVLFESQMINSQNVKVLLP